MGKSDAVSSTIQSDPKRSLDSRHLKTPSRLPFPMHRHWNMHLLCVIPSALTVSEFSLL